MNDKLFLILLLIYSCTAPDVDKAKAEIVAAEKAFQQMTVDKGIAEAFYYFADDSAVIKRENDTLIKGRQAIRDYYNTQPVTASVTWSPSFTAAAASADMGYTYGRYQWQLADSADKRQSFGGVFHTVWRKNKKGEWKYVWD